MVIVVVMVAATEICIRKCHTIVEANIWDSDRTGSYHLVFTSLSMNQHAN